MMKLPSLFQVFIVAMAMMMAPAAYSKDDDSSAQDSLYIRVGETYIFRIEDGKLAAIREADDSEMAQDGELHVTMSDQGGTMLIITNRSGTSYNYRAFIAGNENARGQSTSTCTVVSGISGIEHWPDRLPGIRISDFEPAGDGMICR